MPDLSAFFITKKWPAKHPDRLQLYALPTPNGVKASIMLEETGLPYEPHLVRFDAKDQHSIADIATFPWVRNLIGYYAAGDLVGMANYPHVMRALDAFLARPAVKRGLEIPRR